MIQQVIQDCFYHEVGECMTGGDGQAVGAVGVGGDEWFSGKKSISPGMQVWMTFN